jgi:hypothetical protein
MAGPLDRTQTLVRQSQDMRLARSKAEMYCQAITVDFAASAV